MIWTYDSLSVVPLGPEWNKKTCNYWYLVQNHHGAHVAFNRRESLLNWLRDRGLSIDESKLAPHMQGGKWGTEYPDWLPVTGQYRDVAHMSYDEFYGLENVVVETRQLSNGSYTMARITQGPDGVRTVHTLNPNCKFRPEYDYWQCKEVLG